MNQNIMPEKRTAKFARNLDLEKLLGDLNDTLACAENKVAADYTTPDYPMVFVMGPLRSGTTLFMQWLANTSLAAYPTNLLSRFFKAPIIGAKIQLLLADQRYNFRDELAEFSGQVSYSSENGKTQGVLSPNEFWYFWRQFLKEPQRDVWSDDELRQTMNAQAMLAELAGIMDVFQKPFAAKGMLFNYNIPFLDSVFEKALFVQIERDPVANVASILQARKRQLGDESAWYSFKIPEYEKLQGLPSVEQAAAQLLCINRAVSKGMASVAANRKLVVNYESFCANPEKTFKDLCSLLGVEAAYNGPSSFKATDITDSELKKKISDALAKVDI